MSNDRLAVETLRKIREQHAHQLNNELIKEIDKILEEDDSESMTYEKALTILDAITKAISVIEKIKDMFQ